LNFRDVVAAVRGGSSTAWRVGIASGRLPSLLVRMTGTVESAIASIARGETFPVSVFSIQ